MIHGKKLHLTDAKMNIRKFVDDEIKRSGKHESDLVVGHRIGLSILKKFMADIDALIEKDVKIDSVRIYYAKSTRLRVTDEYDVVIVPVLADGSDYFHVYDKPKSNRVAEAPAKATMLADASSTISSVIGFSTPCPNVCAS